MWPPATLCGLLQPYVASCNPKWPPATLCGQVNDVSVTMAGCLASCATLPLNAAYKALLP